jgi:hypothetical protein
MKTFALGVALSLIGSGAVAQTRGTDFQLTKITKNLVSTPQFSYTGAQQYPTNQRDRWMRWYLQAEGELPGRRPPASDHHRACSPQGIVTSP